LAQIGKSETDIGPQTKNSVETLIVQYWSKNRAARKRIFTNQRYLRRSQDYLASALAHSYYYLKSIAVAKGTSSLIKGDPHFAGTDPCVAQLLEH
jgi:hypothetical protein